MARVLVWSPDAVEDIEAIAGYIERDSPWYAKAVASKIVETAESIPEFPEIGRSVPEIGTSGLSIATASFISWNPRACLWWPSFTDGRTLSPSRTALKMISNLTRN